MGKGLKLLKMQFYEKKKFFFELFDFTSGLFKIFLPDVKWIAFTKHNKL